MFGAGRCLGRGWFWRWGRQLHGSAVPSDDADGGLILLASDQPGFKRGLVGGEAVDVVLLAGEPVLDRLEHGALLAEAGRVWLGIGCGRVVFGVLILITVLGFAAGLGFASAAT